MNRVFTSGTKLLQHKECDSDDTPHQMTHIFSRVISFLQCKQTTTKCPDHVKTCTLIMTEPPEIQEIDCETLQEY